MNKTLVTCPICRCDQHVYKEAIAIHTAKARSIESAKQHIKSVTPHDAEIRCPGSKKPLKDIPVTDIHK
jgi:hypothetical protein